MNDFQSVSKKENNAQKFSVDLFVELQSNDKAIFIIFIWLVDVYESVCICASVKWCIAIARHADWTKFLRCHTFFLTLSSSLSLSASLNVRLIFTSFRFFFLNLLFGSQSCLFPISYDYKMNIDSVLRFYWLRMLNAE